MLLRSLTQFTKLNHIPKLLCGNLGKKVLGEAGKNSLFARLIRDCDIDYLMQV